MAWTTGSATDYVDLLDKLRAYLVTQGWTTLSFTLGTVAAGGGSLFTQGPGAGAGKRVHVEIRTIGNTGTGVYSWELRGATGYNAPGAPLNPGVQGTPCYFNLWQNAITYWFFVNDRRFMVVAKMSTTYSSMYAGFFLPWGTPDSYPFPLYIGGTYATADLVSLSNSAHRFFCDPGGVLGSSSAWLRKPDGVWIPMINHQPSSSNDRGADNGRSNYGFVWPWSVGEQRNSNHDYREVGSITTGGASGGFFDNVIPSRQGEYAIMPISLHSAVDPPFGALDGAFAIPGSGLATEQAISTGGRNFTLFQNIARSSGNDFVAIERI